VSVPINDLNDKIRHVINWAKGGNLTVAQIEAQFTAAATALGSDTTKHDITIQTPPAALIPQSPPSKPPIPI